MNELKPNSMLDDAKPNPLFTFFLCTAGIAAVFVSNATFLGGNEETTLLAFSAFGVTALIAVMPWQLAQSIDSVACPKLHHRLIYAGSVMTLASLFFVSAAILRYFSFHVPQFVNTSVKEYHSTAQSVGVVISAILFLIASSYFVFGFVKFANLLSGITSKHDEVP